MTMKNHGVFQTTTVQHTTPIAVADSSRNKSPTSLPQTSKITGRFRQQKVKSMDYDHGDHGSAGIFMSAPSKNHDEIFDLGVEDDDLFEHHHRSHVDSSDNRALADDFDDDSGKAFPPLVQFHEIFVKR